MARSFKLAALGVVALAATLVFALPGSRAQTTPTFDHLTCVKISRDNRFAPMPPPLTLTPDQSEFLTNTGCKPVGGGQLARANQVCYSSSKDPSNPPSGTDLTGQDFLCYRIKCDRNNGSSRTELSMTDQFGSGTVFANEKPVTKTLCVPAFVGATPTPAPTGTPGVTPTPTETPSLTPTPAPTETAAPTPTPGSASLAFVDPVDSLLR